MRYALIASFLMGAVLWPGLPACAQPRFRPRNPEDFSRVTAGIDRGVQQAMAEAQELIKQEQFVSAVTLLQSVLDHPEDYFLQKDFTSKTDSHPGVKSLANRVLAELPSDGRAAYELHFGPTARALLNEAIVENNVEKIFEVVSNYQMTAAGFDAMQVVAASAFDHDSLIEAALIYETMLDRPDVGETGGCITIIENGDGMAPRGSARAKRARIEVFESHGGSRSVEYWRPKCSAAR